MSHDYCLSYDEEPDFDILPIASRYEARQVSSEHDIRDVISDLIEENCLEEESFYIVDLDVLSSQYQKWKTHLPRATPFYALKSNPRPAIVETLMKLGCGFDCASRDEIDLVTGLGCSPDRIIFANPCKLPSHLKFARTKGVKKMTFDNFDELQKIAQYHPEAELVLRILPDDGHSLMAFGSKFGADLTICTELMEAARSLNLEVIGVSFHVGSGCYDTISYKNTLKLARQVFDFGLELGFDMNFLDIGGGFPGTDHDTITFEEIGAACSPLLEELFPGDIQVIGEPGRFFCHSVQTLVVNLVARRLNNNSKDKDQTTLYYVNEGIYGAFNCIFFDHAKPAIQLLHERPTGAPLYNSKVFGPTCDSMDLICKDILLPKLEVGEWLFFPEMGAYTSAAATSFNGFKTCLTYYIYSTDRWS